MARSRSDIGKLQYRDVLIESSHSTPFSVIIHFREAKETQVKSVVLGLIEERDLCVVHALHYFIQQTTHLRNNLPEDHTLFLAYLHDSDQTASASPSTVATWIKQNMAKAGIDTSVYKAHSIRSAASTKAVEKGSSIQQIKQHANWSHQSNTFEKFYFKPNAQLHQSTQIVNSILTRGKPTTLESESETIRIVVGTTNNTPVGGDEDKNVVNIHPSWLPTWIKNPFH